MPADDQHGAPRLYLSKRFGFDAAHTLQRELSTESSRRIHGHSYGVKVTISGCPDPHTGMIIDFGSFEEAVEIVRGELDHHFLDEVPGMGPATMENICLYIWNRLSPSLQSLVEIAVFRDSAGETCTFSGQRFH